MFKDLIGETVQFYGAVNNQFKIFHEKHGFLIFEAIEDKDDGYRSLLEDVKLKSVSDEIFFKMPLANVIIKEIDYSGELNGFYLYDSISKHIWLEFGTLYSDEYYPMFIFDYNPDKTQYIKDTIPDQSIDRFRLGIFHLVENLMSKGVDSNIICESLINVAEIFHEQPEEGVFLNLVLNISN